jgi:AcrR family transcriptional regulator
LDAEKFEETTLMNDTKDAIVAAYTHLVKSNRSAFPRINDLVRESGIARSTLYRHFDDRSACMRVGAPRNSTSG